MLRTKVNRMISRITKRKRQVNLSRIKNSSVIKTNGHGSVSPGSRGRPGTSGSVLFNKL